MKCVLCKWLESEIVGVLFFLWLIFIAIWNAICIEKSSWFLVRYACVEMHKYAMVFWQRTKKIGSKIETAEGKAVQIERE